MSRLSDVKRRMMLGIEGDEAWKQGKNWQKYMRNWRGLVEPETRLSKATKDVKIVNSNGKIYSFDLQMFAQKDYWVPPDEYAMVMSEARTWLAHSKYRGKTKQKAIADAIYTIKVLKNGDFRILDKQPIDSDMKEWIDEND